MWTPPETAATVAEQFLNYAAWNMRSHYLPMIREAVEKLSDQELWMRPGDASNSVGNLLLHLSGNIRQHIIGGVGGAPDTRDRAGEFAAKEGQNKTELLARLEATVNEACDVLAKFNPLQLLERRVIQNREVVLFDDIFHVVEHFSLHTGQILFAVKALKNQGFDWYKSLDAKPK